MPDEYIIPLSIDVAGVVSKSTQVKTSLTEVGEAAKKAGTEAKDSFDKAGKGATDLSSKLVDNSQKFGTLTKTVEQLTIQMQFYDRIAKKSLDPNIITEYNKKVEALKNQISQLSNVGKKGFDDLGNAVKGSGNFLSQAFSKVRELAYILPGVGIAGILAFATGPITEYISKLDIFKAKITEDKALTEAFGSTDYSKAIQAVTELGVNIKLAKEGFIDKDHVIDQYNESIGRVTGNVDSLDAAEQGLIAHAKDFIRITLLKAAATVVLSEAAKDAAEVAEKNQKLQEKINNLNQDKKTIAANKDPVAFGGDPRGLLISIDKEIVSLNKDIVNNNQELQKNTDKRIEILTNFNEQQGNLKKKLGQTPIVGQGDKSGVAEISKLRNDNANLDLKIKQQQDQIIIDDDKQSFNNRLSALSDYYQKSLQIIKNNADLARSVKGLSNTQIAAIDKKQRSDDLTAEVDFEKKKDALQKQEDQKNADLINLKKQLNDRLITLQNDYNSEVIKGIQDQTARELKANEISTQNKVASLKQQIQDVLDQKTIYDKKVQEGLAKPGADKAFLDDIAQLNRNILQVTQQGEVARDRILSEGIQRRLKAQQESSRAIATLLKQDGDIQVQAIQDNYARIIFEARKNGSLTADIEKQLIIKEQEDIVQARLDIQLKGIQSSNDVTTSKILSGLQKQGETVKQFEARQQKELLAAQIQGIDDQLAVFDKLNAGSRDDGNNPDTVNPLGGLTDEQIKQQAKLIQQKADLKKKADTIGSPGPDNIFDLFGLSTQNAKATQMAYEQTFNSLSTIFSGLSQLAEQNVNAINKQIDAIDALIQKDQDAVDKQQALFDKGRANSLDAAKKKLEDDQKQKLVLQKQAEEAQKKVKALQEAQLASETAIQAASLATAIAKIFAAYAGLPFIGQVLSIAAVGAMIAAFAVAKAAAFTAVNNQTAEDGGVAGGDRHSTGGNKYVSMDGKDRNILEIERGERIFSRKNSEKHKKLFEAIQNNDYSKLDISDVSIRDLLRGTGVMQQLEVAQRVGNQNITLQDRANSVVIVTGNSDKYLSSIDKKMDGLNRREPIVIDYGDYVWIDHGNGYTEKRYK